MRQVPGPVRVPTILRRLGKLGAWIAVAICLYLVIGIAIFVQASSNNRSDVVKLRQLVRDGVNSTASETSTTEHNGVCYQYSVNGVSYSACASANYPGELASSLHPGDSIHITYSASDPTKSCACIPTSEYSGATSGPLLEAAFFPIGPAIVLTLILARVVRSWRIPRESTARLQS